MWRRCGLASVTTAVAMVLGIALRAVAEDAPVPPAVADDVPWPEAAAIVSVRDGELVWWDESYTPIHRQPAPKGVRLAVSDDGIFVVSPSTVWRIRRSQGTGLREAVELPTVEPKLQQAADGSPRAVVSSLDSHRTSLCMQLSNMLGAGKETQATFYVPAKGPPIGRVTRRPRGDTEPIAPVEQCMVCGTEMSFRVDERCRVAFSDNESTVKLPGAKNLCWGPQGFSANLVGALEPNPRRKLESARFIVIDRATGKKVAAVPHWFTLGSSTNAWSGDAVIATGRAPNAAESTSWLLEPRTKKVLQLGQDAVWVRLRRRGP